MKQLVQSIFSFIGVEVTPADHVEKLVSAFGGFVGIVAVFGVSAYFVGLQGSALIVASMGSSAVLLFAVPHGALSQPWPLVGGHAVSALAGVAAATYIADPMTAAAVAVGGAILGMYYLRCLHAPGGATALTAVVGGPGVHELGFQFVLTPVLFNTAVILLAAVAVNYLFAWRRYPASLARHTAAEQKDAQALDALTGVHIAHSDLEFALSRLGSFVDITEEDLGRLFAIAARHAHDDHLDPAQVKIGHCYTNCEYGRDWAIRRVMDLSGDGADAQVTYKIVAGRGRRRQDACTREEFAKWARYEVFQNETSWQKTPGQVGLRY